MLTNTISSIPVCYETANHNVKFAISFGEGKDGEVYKIEKERKNFTKNYDVEVFESGTGDDYSKGYRVVANENPLVIKIGDINIQSENKNENSKYEYGIGFALDNAAPEYYYDYSTIPNNIERDGTMWTIQANNGSSYNFDQNPNANYQWMAKKALDEGYKPTEKELELGMEETSQNTGLIYLTFMVFRKLKPEPVYQGTSRGGSGGATRSSGGSSGGATRCIGGSSGARFGYGNEASSASVKSTFDYVEGTERFVLPIRLRIVEGSEISNINCSQHLKGASLNTLRRQTMTVPF
jgi:hypothetical protein